MKQFPVRHLFSLLVVTFVILSGCDSGDPIDDPNGNVAPVEGTYIVEALAVVPEASRIPALNLLDTLILADTRMQLLVGGDFVLTYRYVGGPTAALFGRYTYSAREVRMEAEPTSSDLHDFRSLLMSQRLVLQRSQGTPEVLTASFRKTVDMASLSDGYQGIPPISATIQFRLREVLGDPIRESNRF